MHIHVITNLGSYHKCDYNDLQSKFNESLMLSKEAYNRIIKKMYDTDITHVHLRGGDPFLNEDLMYLVRYSNKHFPNAEILIHSDGHFIFPTEKFKLLMENGLTGLVLSGYGISQENQVFIDQMNELTAEYYLDLFVEFFYDNSKQFQAELQTTVGLKDIKMYWVYAERRLRTHKFNHIPIKTIKKLTGKVITKKRVYKSFSSFLNI